MSGFWKWLEKEVFKNLKGIHYEDNIGLFLTGLGIALFIIPGIPYLIGACILGEFFDGFLLIGTFLLIAVIGWLMQEHAEYRQH